MPPIVVGIALTVAGLAGTGGAIIAPILFGLGSSLVLSGVAKALQKKPRFGDILRDAASRQFTIRQAAAAWRIVYGSIRMGGIITFHHQRGTDGEFHHFILTLAKGKIQAINTMYFDGVAVPLDGSGDATGTFAGHVHVEKHTGDPADASQPFPDLATAAPSEWTSSHLQRGHAKVHIELKLNRDLFPAGIPNITFDVLGRLVYDPRSMTTVYSNLAALCANDFLTNTDFGLKAVYADEVDETLLIAAANVCDEAVTLKAGGSEDRYTINGAFDSDYRRWTHEDQQIDFAGDLGFEYVASLQEKNVFFGNREVPIGTVAGQAQDPNTGGGWWPGYGQ